MRGSVGEHRRDILGRLPVQIQTAPDLEASIARSREEAEAGAESSSRSMSAFLRDPSGKVVKLRFDDFVGVKM